MKRLTLSTLYTFMLLALLGMHSASAAEGGPKDLSSAASDKDLTSSSSPTVPPVEVTKSPLEPREPQPPTIDQALVKKQGILKQDIRASYDHFMGNYAKYYKYSGLTNDVVKCLDFWTNVLMKMNMSGADKVYRERIRGVLRGALGFLPLVIEEKEVKEDGLNLKDKETVLRAFLATEILSDLHTWDNYWMEDPRYEIEEPPLWEAMHEGKIPSRDQLDILTAISLATREQLLNPHSTLKNLREHVRDRWPGDFSVQDLDRRDHIIRHYITEDGLMAWVRDMEGRFPIREAQKTALRSFQGQRWRLTVKKINDPALEGFLKLEDTLFHYPSSGENRQCGFFSTGYHDRSAKRGPSARDEFFNSVSHSFENHFTANAFIDKVLGGDKIKDMLRYALNNLAPGALPPAEFFARLTDYEKELKDDSYDALKAEAIAEVEKILKDYSQNIEPYLRDHYTDEESDEKSAVDLRFIGKIRAQIRPLVQYLSRHQGAKEGPFARAREILRGEFVKAFRAHDQEEEPVLEAVSSPGKIDTDKELTFRRLGSIIMPFTEGYPYSDPVDGLVISNQNIFPWMDGATIKRTFFETRGSTFQNVRNLAHEIVHRLNLTQADLKRREGDLTEGLPTALHNWLLSHIRREKDSDTYPQFIKLGIKEWGLSELKDHVQRLTDNLKIFPYVLKWWQEQIADISQKKGFSEEDIKQITLLNDQINSTLEAGDIVNFAQNLAIGLETILPLYEAPNAQSWIKKRVRQIKSIISAHTKFMTVLAQENKTNVQLQAVVADTPEAERKQLAQQVYDAVLREGKDGESALTVAINEIINSSVHERKQIIDRLNLTPLIISAVAVAHYPAAHLERLLRLVEKALLEAPVSLAVAESGDRAYYLVDAILATDPEGKVNTARPTHLINFGGGHYEKLISKRESAFSLASVAKAKRHIVKYGLK